MFNPINPPKVPPPVIVPVEKLFVISPELLPTNPPNVPVVLLELLEMETFANVLVMVPVLVLTKPPVLLPALLVDMLTPIF